MSETNEFHVNGVIEINGFHISEEAQYDFLRKISGDNGHVHWNDDTTNAAVMSVEGKQVQTTARRIAWAIYHGGIVKDRRVYTTCGELWCCRPAHLEAERDPDPEAMKLFWSE